MAAPDRAASDFRKYAVPVLRNLSVAGGLPTQRLVSARDPLLHSAKKALNTSSKSRELGSGSSSFEGKRPLSLRFEGSFAQAAFQSANVRWKPLEPSAMTGTRTFAASLADTVGSVGDCAKHTST